MEGNIAELGVDINHTWEFRNGDLVLVSNEENIVQSIMNRLNCEYDSLDDYYFEYGTLLSSFLGFDRSDETLEFIKIEIEATLEQDPRMNNFEVELSYGKTGEVNIYIHIWFDEDSDLNLSLTISEEGNVILNEEGESFGDE